MTISQEQVLTRRRLNQPKRLGVRVVARRMLSRRESLQVLVLSADISSKLAMVPLSDGKGKDEKTEKVVDVTGMERQETEPIRMEKQDTEPTRRITIAGTL